MKRWIYATLQERKFMLQHTAANEKLPEYALVIFRYRNARISHPEYHPE